jgi:hypothetical protein
MLISGSRLAKSSRRGWRAVGAGAALLIATCLALITTQVEASSNIFAALSAKLEPHAVDQKRLNKAQPALVAAATRQVDSAPRGKPQVYVITIAAGGSQALFGREAHAVQGIFASQLGAGSPSVVLSNASLDLFKTPMASRENLSAVLDAIGTRFDPERDMLLLYLTAHGAPQAFVQTDLPDAKQLEPLDAEFLSGALGKARINRRILVISACFAGSWIPALRSPDTIILTAASPYQPSFGCDDRRTYTWYGAALIDGGLGKGSTWHAAYDELSATIARQERENFLLASGPMADVGERMTAVWDAPLRPYAPR